ncbi:MAG: class I SAM-dependent methyltransferase [Flavobacteriales bacterium]
MYHGLKNIFKKILPSGWVKKAAPFVRKRVAWFYKGDKHLCPICETRLKKWVVNTNGYDLICPACGSIQRKRLLWLYLEKEIHITTSAKRILDFSPSPGLSQKLSKLLGPGYVPTDYGDAHSKNRFDITQLPLKENEFDLVFCYHVLEHITDDKKAMSEILRVLKPGGLLIAQVPFKTGETLEENWINTPQLRTEQYGQHDHVRFYGKDDFVKRLEKTGFEVTVSEYSKQFHEKEINALGLNPIEVIFLCRKEAIK